jgi:hypothetical protein
VNAGDRRIGWGVSASRATATMPSLIGMVVVMVVPVMHVVPVPDGTQMTDRCNVRLIGVGRGRAVGRGGRDSPMAKGTALGQFVTGIGATQGTNGGTQHPAAQGVAHHATDDTAANFCLRVVGSGDIGTRG